MARNSNQESSTKGVDPFSIRLISKREFICGSKKWTENGYQKIFHPKNNFCTQGRSSIPYPNTLLHLKSRDEPQAIGPKTLNAPLSVHYTLGILDPIVSDDKRIYRQCYFTLTQYQSVSTFESEVCNSPNTLEPCSTDSLGHQHHTK